MMKNKVCGAYKITNTVTGDFYIGSSKDVKNRWAHHKIPSTWKNKPNSQLYKDMKKYGTDKFDFQILVEVEPEQLKEKEQQFIEMLKPTYNNYNANGINIERCREHQKEYQKSDRYKEYKREYEKSDKRKGYKKEHDKEYQNQLCSYNGEELTLGALRTRFRRAGIPHPTLEAKKYLIENN